MILSLSFVWWCSLGGGILSVAGQLLEKLPAADADRVVNGRRVAGRYELELAACFQAAPGGLVISWVVVVVFAVEIQVGASIMVRL